jgi:hypothetical protein
MKRTLTKEATTKKIIEKNFQGEIIFAEDRMRLEL